MNQLITLASIPSEEKMHGWILYTEGDSSRNPHYIRLYEKACERYGMSIKSGIYHPSVLYGSGEEAARQLQELLDRETPGYVVNRTRDCFLAKLLETKGIPVFNPSRVARLGNDKARAYRYMQQRGIPVMPTIDSGQSPPWYPAIVKACAGHGGTGVFYIQDASAWTDWKKKWVQTGSKSCLHREERYLIQQPASDLGKDVRVFIVGNEIKAAVLRTSQTDFRSNYCLGGNVQLYRLSAKERELVTRATAGLSIGMAGIDFIFHHGQFVFNEIEDMAGARSLYSLTSYDIVDDYIGYIHRELQHRGACESAQPN